MDKKNRNILKEIKKYEKEGILNEKIKEWEDELSKVDEEKRKIWKEIYPLNKLPGIKKYEKELYKIYDKLGPERLKKLKKPSKRVIKLFLLRKKLYDRLYELDPKYNYFYERLEWAKMTPEQRKKRKEEIERAEKETKKEERALKRVKARLNESELNLREKLIWSMRRSIGRYQMIDLFILPKKLYKEEHKHQSKAIRDIGKILYKLSDKKEYFLQAKKLIDNYKRLMRNYYIFIRRYLPYWDVTRKGKEIQRNTKIKRTEKIERKKEYYRQKESEYEKKTSKEIHRLLEKSGALKKVRKMLTREEYKNEFMRALEDYICKVFYDD